MIGRDPLASFKAGLGKPLTEADAPERKARESLFRSDKLPKGLDVFDVAAAAMTNTETLAEADERVARMVRELAPELKALALEETAKEMEKKYGKRTRTDCHG